MTIIYAALLFAWLPYLALILSIQASNRELRSYTRDILVSHGITDATDSEVDQVIREVIYNV